MGGGVSTSHQKLSENTFTDVFVELRGFLKEEGVVGVRACGCLCGGELYGMSNHFFL